ncbi:MAG: hypothetical protein HYY96_03100 [Candidatus Tectomicrobia bacterium]|nr:hypothetical protein [Candidatus Tectomicrobia bacterium]
MAEILINRHAGARRAMVHSVTATPLGAFFAKPLAEEQGGIFSVTEAVGLEQDAQILHVVRDILPALELRSQSDDTLDTLPEGESLDALTAQIIDARRQSLAWFMVPIEAEAGTPEGRTSETAEAISCTTLPESEGDTEVAQANRKAIELLRSWREGDEQEQRETLEHLKAAIDAQPLSNRRRFA